MAMQAVQQRKEKINSFKLKRQFLLSQAAHFWGSYKQYAYISSVINWHIYFSVNSFNSKCQLCHFTVVVLLIIINNKNTLKVVV